MRVRRAPGDRASLPTPNGARRMERECRLAGIRGQGARQMEGKKSPRFRLASVQNSVENEGRAMVERAPEFRHSRGCKEPPKWRNNPQDKWKIRSVTNQLINRVTSVYYREPEAHDHSVIDTPPVLSYRWSINTAL
jgi:hypothetical protein